MAQIKIGFAIVALALAVGCSGSSGANGTVASGTTSFNVTNNGASNFVISGQSNPTLTLQRGQTYTFNISTIGHPFYLTTAPGSTSGSNAYTGNSAPSPSDSETFTFTPDGTTPNTLYYDCTIHPNMTGTINVTN
jgi:plastocyanin